MSKVRTFSRYFPKGHPKEGQPTYFIEKIWQSLYNMGKIDSCLGSPLLEKELEIFSNPSHFIKPKWHTIRAGKHFNAGNYFSPRVWTDKPYSSKQIAISPDIQIKKVWDIWHDSNGWWINENSFYALERLAENDGLSLPDFLNWFNIHPKKKGETFNGQIICWSESVEY